MLALLDGFERLNDVRYLADARTLATWIVENLADRTGISFGGFYLGYPDEGVIPKPLIKAKSIENNADIFAAFSRLAAIESRLGNNPDAEFWMDQAVQAGDFVMALFDDRSGCFFAGTVPVATMPGLGIDPSGSRRGNDVINVFQFLDANTFIPLAMAEAPRYRDAIDWRRPVNCVRSNFKRTIIVNGKQFHGFGIEQETLEGPDGIAWEFTAQVVSTMRLVDRLYNETTLEVDVAFYLDQLRQAQLAAPFRDGGGIVASTLQDGEALPPIDQCLSTPFQCIPQRVGLAATAWAVYAERAFNPLSPVRAPNSNTDLLVEVGSARVDHQWQSVPLVKAFTNPIVVAKPASQIGADPGVIRLRNVTSQGFDIRFQEWDYLNRIHATETVSYLATERGHFLVDGGAIEAGIVQFDNSRPGRASFIPVNFDIPFSTTPVVLTVVGSSNGKDAVTSRLRNVTNSGFEVIMQEQESHGRHAQEQIHWIAIEPGIGLLGDGNAPIRYEANSQSGVDHHFSLLEFSQLRNPCVLADIQTFKGKDTVALRYRDLTETGIWMRLEEEQSADSEIFHIGETVGYAAFECQSQF